jgi:hypothetical protein
MADTVKDLIQRLETVEAAFDRRLGAVETAIGIGHNQGPPLDEELSNPESEIGEQRLGATAVARRYGVVVRTIDRWLANSALAFSRPEITLGRRYWRLDTLRVYDRARTQATTPTNPGKNPKKTRGP